MNMFTSCPMLSDHAVQEFYKFPSWSCHTRLYHTTRTLVAYMYMRMHVCAEYQPVFQTADGFWSHLGPSSSCTQWNVNSLPTPGSSSSEESELHGTAITWQGATLQSWAARNWLSHEILPFPQSPVRWCPPRRLLVSPFVLVSLCVVWVQILRGHWPIHGGQRRK